MDTHRKPARSLYENTSCLFGFVVMGSAPSFLLQVSMIRNGKSDLQSGLGRRSLEPIRLLFFVVVVALLRVAPAWAGQPTRPFDAPAECRA